MGEEKQLQSVVRWLFHKGKGGFHAANIRPDWDGMTTEKFVEIVGKEIKPRIADNIQLGIELHYDGEIGEDNAEAVANQMEKYGLVLAMITPGAHSRWSYGGVASLDPQERREAEDFGKRTIDLAYGPLRRTWSKDMSQRPSVVIWNGAWGYDLSVPQVAKMYANAKESTAGLVRHEKSLGGMLDFGIEPKTSEGHPAHMLQASAQGIEFWRQLAKEFDLEAELNRLGMNTEFGHVQMPGLCMIQDYAQQFAGNWVKHMHVNDQGGQDGVTRGGASFYDIDFGVKIHGQSLSTAQLVVNNNYKRWFGHDMQARPYDNSSMGINRVVESIANWQALLHTAKTQDWSSMDALLAKRDTLKAEWLMQDILHATRQTAREIYKN